METRILLVDDERDFVEPLAERLALRGFQARTAYSGREALTVISENEIDVVILDLMMPGLSGSETLRLIKEENPLVQVIMLTGKATVSAAIEDMKLGAYDFLMKPADIGELVKKVNGARKVKAEHEERIREADIGEIVGKMAW